MSDWRSASNTAAFSLDEGGFTRNLIEDEHAFYLLKVESRQAGKAEAFDDPKAQEAIKAVLAARRLGAAIPGAPPGQKARSGRGEMQGMAAGDFSEAEKLLEQAFAMQRAELGAEDPKTLDTMGNLAACRLRLGQLEVAIKMHIDLLALCQKVLGPEHLDTLTAMNNLAICQFQVDHDPRGSSDCRESETRALQRIPPRARHGKEMPARRSQRRHAVPKVCLLVSLPKLLRAVHE